MSESASFARLMEAAQINPPHVALVLGSGLGQVAQRLTHELSIPFNEIPGLSTTSVPGHRGSVILGEWVGKRVLLFDGRLHQYEGHSHHAVVMPVIAASFFGAPAVLFTNAAGGIHDCLAPGALMAIRDHIEWNRPYAWRHAGREGIGPERLSPYSPRLLQILVQAAQAVSMEIPSGTYASVTGPNYETPAEIRALKACGVDAVGMSTTREARAAGELGMECVAVSCITNRAAGLGPGPIKHEEVLATASRRSAPLADLLEAFIRLL